MIFATLCLFAAMSASDAVVCLLNTTNSCGARVAAEAHEIVYREAAAGKPLYQFVVGVTTSDKELAKRYLDASREKIRQLAETKNNPLAWYLLSVEKNDFALLKKAADGGNVQALNALGSIAVSEAFDRRMEASPQLELILKRSHDYFLRAAQQRDANGFINLGTCYQRGFGCKQDLGLAFRCYAAAAELGHPEGMDYLSAAYQLGHGVPRNNELSLVWAMRARALRGNAAAEKWLRNRR